MNHCITASPPRRIGMRISIRLICRLGLLLVYCTTFHSFETSYSTFSSFARSLSSMVCKWYMLGVYFRPLSVVILIIV
jgi:hypothetical protein